MSHHMAHTITKTEVLPPNFVFSSDDRAYYGPSTCEYMHYRTAAVLGASIEFILQLSGTAIAFYLYSEIESLEYFVVMFMAIFFMISTLMTIVMLYGLWSGNADLIKPKIVIQQVQIAFLLALATLAIGAMCIGIDATNSLFGVFLRVQEMERDFGPIWPFNISVLAFMAAAIGVWIRILSSGAHDFLLDKEFFASTERTNIPMESKNRDD